MPVSFGKTESVSGAQFTGMTFRPQTKNLDIATDGGNLSKGGYVLDDDDYDALAAMAKKYADRDQNVTEFIPPTAVEITAKLAEQDKE